MNFMIYFKKGVSKIFCHCGRSVAKTRNLQMISSGLLRSARNDGSFSGLQVKSAMTGFDLRHLRSKLIVKQKN